MYTFIIILITFIAILLTLTVLLQSGQGQGLSGGIAGNMAANSVLGARRTSDFLSKSTTYLGTAFLVLCLASNYFIDRQATGGSIITGATVDAPAPISTPSAIPADTSGN